MMNSARLVPLRIVVPVVTPMQACHKKKLKERPEGRIQSSCSKLFVPNCFKTNAVLIYEWGFSEIGRNFGVNLTADL